MFYIFGYSHFGCINIYSCYIFLLDCPLYDYIVSFFVSCYSLFSKVYFFWYMNCYSGFVLTSICMIDVSPSPFSLQVSLVLKWVSCIKHVDGSWFYIHSDTPCLWIGAFSIYIQSNYWKICIHCYFSTCFVVASEDFLWSFLVFLSFMVCWFSLVVYLDFLLFFSFHIY